MNVYKQEIDFLLESKEIFKKNPNAKTYTNGDLGLMALRTGFDENSILIYRVEECLFVEDFIE